MRFRLLPDAPRPLAHNQRVDFFSGAAEVRAYARVLGAEQIEPGAEGWLQLRLAQPVVVLRRAIALFCASLRRARRWGAAACSIPLPRRRWRRFDPAALARLETLSRGAPEEIVLQALARQPLAAARELLRGVDLEARRRRRCSAALRATGAVVDIPQEGGEALLLTLEAWQALQARLHELLGGYHRQYPLRRGMPRGEVRSRLQGWLPQTQVSVRLFNAVLAAAQAEGVLAADDQAAWQAPLCATAECAAGGGGGHAASPLCRRALCAAEHAGFHADVGRRCRAFCLSVGAGAARAVGGRRAAAAERL